MNTFYDQIADHYDGAYQRPIDQAEDHYVVQTLKQNGCFDGLILDAGCGTGAIINSGLLAPDRYTGIDVSDGMLEAAYQAHPGYMFYNLNYHECLKWRADNIFCLYGALNYSQRPALALQNFKRTLKPGGKLVIVAYAPGRLHYPHPVITNDHIMKFSPPYNYLWFLNLLHLTFSRVFVRSFSGPLSNAYPLPIGLNKLCKTEADWLTKIAPESGKYYLAICHA